jgi:hypothetical protein
MPGHLYIIANATDVGVNFANTENQGDDLSFESNDIKITGGTHGDYSNIPTCEKSEDFNAHHMSVLSLEGSVNICFWKNNSLGNIIYYSRTANFNESATMPGGEREYSRAALLISKNDGQVSVKMSDVDSNN